jgi:hypothetical protein
MLLPAYQGTKQLAEAEEKCALVHTTRFKPDENKNESVCHK